MDAKWLMNRWILFICLWSVTQVCHSTEFRSTDGYVVRVDNKSGYLADDGDIPWKIWYCPIDAEMYCFLSEGYWFNVSVPKKSIAVGDTWIFSGKKYTYLSKIDDERLLIESQLTDSWIKSRPQSCAVCKTLTVLKINHGKIILEAVLVFSGEGKVVQVWGLDEEFKINVTSDEVDKSSILRKENVLEMSKKSYVIE